MDVQLWMRKAYFRGVLTGILYVHAHLILDETNFVRSSFYMLPSFRQPIWLPCRKYKINFFFLVNRHLLDVGVCICSYNIDFAVFVYLRIRSNNKYKIYLFYEDTDTFTLIIKGSLIRKFSTNMHCPCFLYQIISLTNPLLVPMTLLQHATQRVNFIRIQTPLFR